MNINIDNYEAYLLDYMEGNLDPDDTRQLKAFVVAQGLDWDELTEDLPHLEALQIEFEDKERLKKRRAVVPLYVKMASAAAAAGLLLTVSLWPEKSLPQLEPIAELNPIKTHSIMLENDLLKLPKKPTHFVKPIVVVKEEPVIFEKTELPLLAELEPIQTKETQIANPTAIAEESDFEWLTYRMNNNLASNQFSHAFQTFDEDEESLSLISRGLLWLTEGRHSSFASLISSSLTTAKKEISLAATDMALATYDNISDQFEEAKERWEEKRGE